MNPVVAVWVASFAGVCLFFAAGYLASLRRSSAELGAIAAAAQQLSASRDALMVAEVTASTERERLASALGVARERGSALEAELGQLASTRAETEAALRRQLDAAKAKSAALEAERVRLAAQSSAALAAETARAQRLGAAHAEAERRATLSHQALEAKTAEHSELRARLGTMRAKDSELDQLRARERVLHDDLEEARHQSERLVADAAAALASSKAEAQRLADALWDAERSAVDAQQAVTAKDAERREVAFELEALRSSDAELAKARERERVLRQELEEALAEIGRRPDPEVVRGLEREVSLQTESARMRKEQLEVVSNDNATLRRSVEELPPLRQEIVRLARDNEDLRAQGFLATTGRSEKRPAVTAGGQSLKGLVEHASELDRVSVAAISDELGFVVASSGEHGDALAAFGAFLADVGMRATGLLPLRNLSRVSVQDEHMVRVTACPMEGGMVLVTLGVGEEPDMGDLRTLIDGSAAPERVAVNGGVAPVQAPHEYA